eukprot:SAG31_NODE_1786_length_7271_cov_6.872492_6_plen_113_part_00
MNEAVLVESGRKRKKLVTTDLQVIFEEFERRLTRSTCSESRSLAAANAIVWIVIDHLADPAIDMEGLVIAATPNVCREKILHQKSATCECTSQSQWKKISQKFLGFSWHSKM